MLILGANQMDKSIQVLCCNGNACQGSLQSTFLYILKLSQRINSKRVIKAGYSTIDVTADGLLQS